MAGFSWMGFTQGAMEGAMNIAEQRRKQADDYFKRLDGIYEKTRQEKIKADQQLASATALAKQYNVDTSYVINAQLQELKGNDLIEYLQRAKPKSGATSVADVKAQTDKILGLDTLSGGTGVENQQSILQKPSAETQAIMNSPEGKALEKTVQTTDPTANMVSQKPAETAPKTGPTSPMIPSMGKGPETNGTGALGAVSTLLFGPTARDRAMTQFEETYGKDAVAYLNQGGKSAYMQEASKPSQYEVGPKKTDFSKIVEKLTPGDFRTREDYSRFTALVEQGKYQEAMAIPMDFDTRKKIETQSAIAASTAAAVAGAKAAAQYGQQGILNLINPKTGEMTAVNSRDGAAIKQLTGQGFVEASNYGTVKEARMTPIERIASKLTRADFNSNEDFAKAAQFIKAGKPDEAIMLMADPVAKEKAMEEFKAGLKSENKEVNTRTMINPKLAKDDPNYMKPFLATDKEGLSKAVAEGYVEVPKNWSGKQEDLLGGKKTEGDIIQTYTALNNVIDGVQEIKKRVLENPTANTYAGNVALSVSNVVNDLKGFGKLAGIEMEDYVPKDPRYMQDVSAFEWAGKDAARVKAAFSNLLYSVAKAKGESGKSLSDADINRQVDEIGMKVRNPVALFAVLDDLTERTVTQSGNFIFAATGKELDRTKVKPIKSFDTPSIDNQRVPGQEVKPKPLPIKSGKPDESSMTKGQIYIHNGKQVRYLGDSKVELVE